MRIVFVVERPTQFEVPFFRHVAAEPAHHLRVLYTDPAVATPAYDPELGRVVDWGFDLLGGYDHASCPPRGRARWLAGELRRGCYDLVIVNGYTRPAYVVATILALRAGIPTALRLDSVLLETPPPRAHAKRMLFDALLKRVYRLFLGTGTLTLDYLRYFGVPAARIGLFPYAIDVEGFRRGAARAEPQRAAVRARFGLPAEARVLLSVAKLHPREAPWDLLRAFSLQDDAQVWLALAGDGPARGELEEFVRARNLERVVFLGYVPYQQLPELYAAADVFIHPAREERWGVSVAEALACGLPAITSTRVGAARDLITPGENGYTYQAGDDQELSRRIGEALALAKDRVRDHNRAVLARWDYPATWRHLLEAASRLQAKAVA